MPFSTGRHYSWSDILEKTGADGSPPYYLPHRGYEVVAACLTLGLDPEAPLVILAGNGPLIAEYADYFCAQNRTIPVFVKSGDRQWLFAGISNWSEQAPTPPRSQDIQFWPRETLRHFKICCGLPQCAGWNVVYRHNRRHESSVCSRSGRGPGICWEFQGHSAIDLEEFNHNQYRLRILAVDYPGWCFGPLGREAYPGLFSSTPTESPASRATRSDFDELTGGNDVLSSRATVRGGKFRAFGTEDL
jgi:hypothetical protein